MEQETLVVNKAQMWDISSRLYSIYLVLDLLSDSMETGRFQGVAFYLSQLLNDVTKNFSDALDKAENGNTP